MIISPEEVELLPVKLFAKMDEINCVDIVVGAKEILFLGTKGSPGTYLGLELCRRTGPWWTESFACRGKY